ncbi:MAG: ORF6N domain-containing protein [Desulfobacterales bacterium]|nr:ORF6N domain-containing protein [Desulfobacterales bacterium]
MTVYYKRHALLIDYPFLINLYGVETRVLNQAVKRHKKRFPDDFWIGPSEHLVFIG